MNDSTTCLVNKKMTLYIFSFQKQNILRKPVSPHILDIHTPRGEKGGQLKKKKIWTCSFLEHYSRYKTFHMYSVRFVVMNHIIFLNKFLCTHGKVSQGLQFPPYRVESTKSLILDIPEVPLLRCTERKTEVFLFFSIYNTVVDTVNLICNKTSLSF